MLRLIPVVLGFIAWTGALAQGLTPLSQSELEAEFKRDVRWEFKTATASGRTENSVTGKAWTDGFAGPNRFNDMGKFVVRDGAVCYTWTRLREGKETCNRFARRGEKLVAIDAHGHEAEWRKEIK